MMFCLMVPILVQAQPAGWGPFGVKEKSGKGNYALVNGVLEQKDNGDISQPRITMPQLISYPKIDFPGKQHKTGMNRVELIVGVDGKPSDIRIVHSLRADYDEQTMNSVRQYRFKPAEFDGKPVPIQIAIEVHYKIW
jgi:TonB family protein